MYPLIHAFQPLLAPVCFVTAWALVVLVLWSIWTAVRDGTATVKRLHQIPCANCQFFTDDYILKCTVHPTSALTEEAINCSDFCPQNRPV
jgi:hypothetical protein